MRVLIAFFFSKRCRPESTGPGLDIFEWSLQSPGTSCVGKRFPTIAITDVKEDYCGTTEVRLRLSSPLVTFRLCAPLYTHQFSLSTKFIRVACRSNPDRRRRIWPTPLRFKASPRLTKKSLSDVDAFGKARR